ncbi:MAG: damage-control phosphatase ARMT1 family protein [Desulforhopalus sp.]
MKTDVDCLPCLLRQTIQVARLSTCCEKKVFRVVQAVSALVAGLDERKSPPANASAIYKEIANFTGCEDPYRQKKEQSNEQALERLPELRREIRGTAGEFAAAIRFAIAGNIIDFGALQYFDIEATLARCRTEKMIVDCTEQLLARIDKLHRNDKVLYLADNCGEIVYDSLLLECLAERGFDITVAVKDGPIINDALVEDGYRAGLDRFGRIISNGTRCPGTVLAECSDDFLDHFSSADLIIAKGQGNFESLSEVDREIFFLLTVKCVVAGRHLAELAGIDTKKLPGKGEMVVFCSTMKKNSRVA